MKWLDEEVMFYKENHIETKKENADFPSEREIFPYLDDILKARCGTCGQKIKELTKGTK